MSDKISGDVMCRATGQTNAETMTDRCPTLNCAAEQPIVTYAIQGNMLGRDDRNGPQGCGINGDVCFTLNATDVHAVCTCDTFGNAATDGTHPTLLARDYKDPPFVGEAHEGEYVVRRITPTECARLQGFPDEWGDLPPVESFDDDEAAFWEKVREIHAIANGKKYKPFSSRDKLVAWYNKLHSDSSEYKMWGNGIALPCAEYVLNGIAQVLDSTWETM